MKQKSFDSLFNDIQKVRDRERKRLLTLDKKANRTKRYIYLLDCNAFFKIGTAVNIDKRVNDITRELNTDVSVVYAKEIDNKLAIEIEYNLVIELYNQECIVLNESYFGKHESFIKDEEIKTQVLEYLKTSTTIETT